MKLLSTGQHLEIAQASQVIHGLSLINSANADNVFSDIAKEGFDPDWYNCDAHTAELLLEILKAAKNYQSLKQQNPNITLVFPKDVDIAFDNLYHSLCGYEVLIKKLCTEKLTESQIESELLQNNK